MTGDGTQASARVPRGSAAPEWPLTVSELALLLEGSELVGKVPLSPMPFVLQTP